MILCVLGQVAFGQSKKSISIDSTEFADLIDYGIELEDKVIRQDAQISFFRAQSAVTSNQNNLLKEQIKVFRANLDGCNLQRSIDKKKCRKKAIKSFVNGVGVGGLFVLILLLF